MRLRTRRRILVALIVALTLCMVGAKESEPLKVTITPRMGLSPLKVTVRVSVFQGDPAWTCPAVSIIWPDLSKSEAESDCDPADPDFDPLVRSRRLSAGTWEVLVSVRQGGKERVFRQTIEVL